MVEARTVAANKDKWNSSVEDLCARKREDQQQTVTNSNCIKIIDICVDREALAFRRKCYGCRHYKCSTNMNSPNLRYFCQKWERGTSCSPSLPISYAYENYKIVAPLHLPTCSPGAYHIIYIRTTLLQHYKYYLQTE